MRIKVLLLFIIIANTSVFSQSVNLTRKESESSQKVNNLNTKILKSKNDTEKGSLEEQLKTEKENNPLRKLSEKQSNSLIEKKQSEINELITKLDENVGENNEVYDKIQDDIKKKQIELEDLEEEKKVRLAQFDGNYSTFFPSVNKLYQQQFFKSIYNKDSKTKYINTFGLSANNEGALVQSEIITDNLNFLRLSFGSVITSSSETPTDANEIKEETENDAIKRLIGGGGNFYLEAQLPLITTNNENKGWVTMYTYANVIGGADIKGFGNNLETSTANGSVGITTFLGATSDKGKFNFFVQGNLNYTMGSDDFYTNLGLNEEKGFLNGKLIAGVTLINTFRLSAIISSYGSDEKIRSGNVIFGVQILPSL